MLRNAVARKMIKEKEKKMKYAWWQTCKLRKQNYLYFSNR